MSGPHLQLQHAWRRNLMISSLATLLLYACSFSGCGAVTGSTALPDPGVQSAPTPKAVVATPPTNDTFAFWYESWTPQTWKALQPANAIIGVPAQAVGDIHSHGGKALNYVTLYQARFGSFFIANADDLNNVGFHTPNGFLPSAFGGLNNFVLCSNSAEMRARALAYVTATIVQNKFDGLFVDNTYLPPAAKLICDAKHPHVKQGEDGGTAYIDLLKTVYDAVKQANPSALVITNPGDPNSFASQSNGLTLWDVSDYVLWESYVYTSIVGPDHIRMGAIARSYALARTLGGKIVALSYPMNASEALYSYAVASAFGFKYAANLGVNQQTNPANGGHFGIFAPQLPGLTGSPTDPPPTDGAPILIRHYSNGMVIVNTTNADLRTVAEQSGTLYTQSGSTAVKKGDPLTVLAGQVVILIS